MQADKIKAIRLSETLVFYDDTFIVKALSTFGSGYIFY